MRLAADAPTLPGRAIPFAPAGDRTLPVAGLAAWGWLPALSLVAACALLVFACADALALSGAARVEWLFWAAYLVLLLPFTFRLMSAGAMPRERLGLVVLLGLAFYLVKVLHSPRAFTFGDELLHLHNVNAMLDYGVQFYPNPILPVSAYYPGLESVTAALAALGGLSPFAAGLFVIGAARFVMAAALYLFYEQVGGSPRVAGLAALLYMANSNFLFWSAQFSYESLALPLAVLVIYAVARRECLPPGVERSGLAPVAVLGILAVVVTHHLTSYALVAFLWLIATGYFVRSRFKGGGVGPWSLAFLGLAAAGGWLLFVASVTLGYLSTIFSRAVLSLVQMISGEAAGRRLFESTTGVVAPLWERLTGFASVGLPALAQPTGLGQVGRRFRLNVFGLVLAAASLAYFAMQALRFTHAGWETGNRASEFLFVGLAFVVALAIVRTLEGRRARFLRQAAFTGGVAVIFTGGVIAGWSRDLRVPWLYTLAAQGALVEPQGVAAARWAEARLGPDNRFAADSSNAMLLLDYGGQFAYSGRNFGIHEVIAATPLADWQIQLLRDMQIRYIAVDRRKLSWDNMTGLYLGPSVAEAPANQEWIEPGVFDKFERQDRVSRFFDSGNLVLYDVGAISHAAPNR